MTDVTIPDVLVWLARTTAADASRLLVGCALDDGKSDAAARIVDTALDRQALILADGRRVMLGSVRDGLIIDDRPNTPLATAIETARPPAEHRDRADRRELAREGIDPDKLASAEDRAAVLVLLRSVRANTAPTERQRHDFYLAITAGGDRGLARVGAHVFGDIASRYSKLTPEDLHWRRAVLLRASGQLREAIDVSAILNSGQLRDPGCRRILATTRAAALLDLFESTGDRACLAEADRAARTAYALGPADEAIAMIFRRLDRARSRGGRHDALD